MFVNNQEMSESLSQKALTWKWSGLAIFSLGVVWVLVYNLTLGYGILSNDSHYYLKHATGIHENGLSHFSEKSFPRYHFFLPTTLAILKTLFGSAWKEGFLALHCLTSGAFFLGCFRLGELLRGWKAGLLSVVFAMGCNEYLSWSRYVLTDILFASITLWFVYTMLKLEALRWKSYWGWTGFFLLLALVILVRRVGLLFPLALSVYLFFRVLKQTGRRWCLRISLASVVLMVAGCLTIALIWNNIDIQFHLNLIVGWFENGVVIRNRPEYNLSATEFLQGNIFERVAFIGEIVSLRFLMFWNPFIIGYSRLHLIFNGLTLFPAFLLSIYTFIRHFKGQFLALFSVLFTVTLVHSVTFIDYDHRYRVPLLGFVLVLAGVGFLDLVNDLRPFLTRIFRRKT